MRAISALAVLLFSFALYNMELHAAYHFVCAFVAGMSIRGPTMAELLLDCKKMHTVAVVLMPLLGLFCLFALF